MIKSIRKVEVKSRRIRIASPKAIYNAACEIPVTGPEVVDLIANTILEGEDQEVFLVFLLDVKNKITGFVEAARGGFEVCPVDPRVVFRAAVINATTSIILAHNHPSGEPEPSEEDVALTERIKQAGVILGITVLDHVVVTSERGRHYSFREHGRM